MATTGVSLLVEKYCQIGHELDASWYLTGKQKEYLKKLTHICLTEIRPHAIELDEYRQMFPWKSLTVLSKMGLFGLLAPKELGGMGETHSFAAAVVETIARYGCPSTAMVFVMHTLAVTIVSLRYHDNEPVKECLRRCNGPEPYLGTASYSDPSTGTHYWFPFSSKVAELADGYQLLKYGSWATSAGFADWYAMQTLSPNYQGDGSNLSVFLVYKHEVRANTVEWKSLGMHGNQSGALVAEGFVSKDRLVGVIGEGRLSNDEAEDPFFLLLSSSVWNGLSLALMDVAKKHVLRREHVDTGMRVADYPTIQDYFGECFSAVTSARHFLYGLTARLDAMTNNCDWTLHKDPKFLPRTEHIMQCFAVKFETAKVLTMVTDKMLHACGGLGYKKQLGLERLFRDGKAAWVMGPSNEPVRQIMGQIALFGEENLDLWSQKSNSRVLSAELRKLTSEQRKELLKELMMAEEGDERAPSGPPTEEDFYNPLVPGDRKPAVTGRFLLQERRPLAEQTEELVFKPDAIDGMSLICGQYVEIDLSDLMKKPCKRYLSPTSPINQDTLALTVKYESSGILSEALQMIKPGDGITIRGPCGGYEYKRGSLKQMVFICSGVGITPAIQIIRTVAKDPQDTTKIILFYHAETPEELLFREEMETLAAEKGGDQIQIKLCVSEALGASGTGELKEGYVGREILEAHVSALLDASSRTLLCGGPSMVISSLYSLRALGHSSSNIYIYGPFGTEFLKAVYGRNAKLMKTF